MNVIQWEYLIVQQPEALPSLGLDGWELVSVVLIDNHPNHYLKRPAPDFRQRLTEDQRKHAYAQLKVEPS